MNLRKHKRLAIGLCTVVVLGAAIFFKLSNKNVRQNIAQSENFPEATEKFAGINGVLVSQEKAGARPFAVMVENHPDSRPQSGLSQADIVYETLAEGGITRFLAIFQSNQPDTVGPVRSARDYFAEIADEWEALYAHVGGSNEVIEALKKGVYKNLSDINEYHNETYFRRVLGKSAPHNVFTSYSSLKKWLEDKQEEQGMTADPWKFKDDMPLPPEVSTSKISMDFSRPGYEVSYVYATGTNTYLREIYFESQIDAENGKQIEVKNVVVQMVEVTPVPKDPLLKVDIDLKAGGRAVVFRDGEVIEGIWKKENGRTRYFDLQGREVEFNRGPIWVELLPSEKASSLDWE